MARHRPAPTPAQADRTDLEVPPELRVGALAEVWSATGDPADLLGGRARYVLARSAWETATGVTVQESCRLLPPGRPWSLAEPSAEARLTLLDLTTHDVPRLRHAAGTYPTDPRSTRP